jgi:hypothetical protein
MGLSDIESQVSADRISEVPRGYIERDDTRIVDSRSTYTKRFLCFAITLPEKKPEQIRIDSRLAKRITPAIHGKKSVSFGILNIHAGNTREIQPAGQPECI